MGGMVSFCLRSSACSVYVYRLNVHRRIVGQVVLLCHCYGLFAWEKSRRHVPWSPTSESLSDPRSPARAVRSAPGPNAPRLPRRVSASPPTPGLQLRGLRHRTWSVRLYLPSTILTQGLDRAAWNLGHPSAYCLVSRTVHCASNNTWTLLLTAPRQSHLPSPIVVEDGPTEKAQPDPATGRRMPGEGHLLYRALGGKGSRGWEAR